MTTKPTGGPAFPARDLISECLPECDHYMAPAWLGLLRYASQKDEIIKQFEDDTGMKFRVSAGIEGMVDEATGYREDMIFSFAHWVTKNLWGNSGVVSDTDAMIEESWK